MVGAVSGNRPVSQKSGARSFGFVGGRRRLASVAIDSGDRFVTIPAAIQAEGLSRPNVIAGVDFSALESGEPRVGATLTSIAVERCGSPSVGTGNDTVFDWNARG